MISLGAKLCTECDGCLPFLFAYERVLIRTLCLWLFFFPSSNISFYFLFLFISACIIHYSNTEKSKWAAESQKCTRILRAWKWKNNFPCKYSIPICSFVTYFLLKFCIEMLRIVCTLLKMVCVIRSLLFFSLSIVCLFRYLLYTYISSLISKKKMFDHKCKI